MSPPEAGRARFLGARRSCLILCHLTPNPCPFSTYTVRMVFIDRTLRKHQGRTSGPPVMPQKKKTQEIQESQQLSPGSFAPSGREPMTGAQASYLKMLAED